MAAEESIDGQTIERVGDGEWLGESGLIYVEKREVTPVIGKAMVAAFVAGLFAGALITAVIANGGVAL